MLCLILSNAFNFIWIGLVTDICVSAQLSLEANIACNLTLPSEDLAGLRTQFQHLFSALPEDGAARLRDFMNQTDVLELAKFVSACLKCCA